jgi:hypothetical protein
MSTTARFAPNMLKNKDNTDRVLNNDYQTPAYAAILNIVTKAANTLIKPLVLTGNVTVNIAVGGTAGFPPFVGDTIQMIFLGDATIRTITFGTGIAITYSSLALAVSKRGYVSFVFDGTLWMQSLPIAQA